MDRFVWFVLLVVMSHLVTEFTRVTGYARGPRQDAVTVNDTLILPKQVQNMVLYPGQDYYNPYNRPSNYNNNNNQNSAILSGNSGANNEQGFLFSFRPLIDSIFEIPISTLRAVNNLVARLTGSYQQAPSPKSVEALSMTLDADATSYYPAPNNNFAETILKTSKTAKKSTMREESV